MRSWNDATRCVRTINPAWNDHVRLHVCPFDWLAPIRSFRFGASLNYEIRLKAPLRESLRFPIRSCRQGARHAEAQARAAPRQLRHEVRGAPYQAKHFSERCRVIHGPFAPDAAAAEHKNESPRDERLKQKRKHSGPNAFKALIGADKRNQLSMPCHGVPSFLFLAQSDSHDARRV